MSAFPPRPDGMGYVPVHPDQQEIPMIHPDPTVQAARVGIDQRLSDLDVRLLTTSLVEDAFSKSMEENLRLQTQLDQARQDVARAELMISRLRQQCSAVERVAAMVLERALETVFNGLINGAYGSGELRGLASAVERAQRVPVAADRALLRAVAPR